MKKTNKFQTVKDVIELIESIPKWHVEIKVHFVKGDDPNLCEHIWISSIEEFKRVVPKIFYNLKISSYKMANVDGRFSNSIEYLISIDTKYYGFGVAELKQMLTLNKHILSSTEDIEVQTAKLDRIDNWSRKLAEEFNISPQAVIAVRDRLILLQRTELTEENNVPYTTIVDRVKFDEKEISKNKRFIRAMEKTINAKNKEIKY